MWRRMWDGSVLSVGAGPWRLVGRAKYGGGGSSRLLSSMIIVEDDEGERGFKELLTALSL
jgi:hypothetical protein